MAPQIIPPSRRVNWSALLSDLADTTSIIGVNASTTHGVNEAMAQARADAGEFVSVPVVGRVG